MAKRTGDVEVRNGIDCLNPTVGLSGLRVYPYKYPNDTIDVRISARDARDYANRGFAMSGPASNGTSIAANGAGRDPLGSIGSK